MTAYILFFNRHDWVINWFASYHEAIASGIENKATRVETMDGVLVWAQGLGCPAQ